MEISAVSSFTCKSTISTNIHPIIRLSCPASCSFKFPSNYRRFGAISCKAGSKNMGKEGRGSRDLYSVLSLESENASLDEIKKAYRSMALQYHPDLCPPTRKEEFTRMFVEVNKAYETLSDPVLRQIYDHELVNLGEAASRRSRRRSDIGMERWDLVREAWKTQLVELKRRSDYRMRQAGEGSWGSRMRAGRD